jgi:hypothetical protein
VTKQTEVQQHDARSELPDPYQRWPDQLGNAFDCAYCVDC